MPNPVKNGWLQTEIYPGEFPKMWNFNDRHLNIIECYYASSCTFLVKPSFKYTLLRRLWNICYVPWRTVGCGWSYKQGNSPKDEIRIVRRTWDPARFWSKWHWNIHSWVASKVYAKYHDDRTSMDGATSRGIPSDAKLETDNEHDTFDVSGQSDVEIYIIGPPLKYMPIPITIPPPWTELQAGEFPHMRN